MFQKKTITFLASSVPPRMACGQARRTADVALPPLLPIVEAEGRWIVRHVAGWRGPSMLSLTLSFLREAEKDVVCGGAHLLVFSLDSHSYWGGGEKRVAEFLCCFRRHFSLIQYEYYKKECFCVVCIWREKQSLLFSQNSYCYLNSSCYKVFHWKLHSSDMENSIHHVRMDM